jgi:hypothetical protein
MQLNDPNPQANARLKNWAQKRSRVFRQNPNPNRASLSPKREPA